jgi:hypothetical protein
MPDTDAPRVERADRFETSATEDTIVKLNTLCDACSTFLETSPLLCKLANGDKIRMRASEIAHVGSPKELKAGYQGGTCHLCALLWDRAGGHLLDPTKSDRCGDPDAPVVVELEARDDEKEYAIMVETENDKAKKLWRRVAPTPSM